MNLWSKRRGHLQTLRVVALVPLAVAHLIAWDLVVRYACAILTADPQKNDARISHLGKRVAASNGVAVIFPEGRKSAKNYADILPFMPSGLDRLVAAAPSARVVAVAIKGTHAAWPGAWQLPKPDALIEVMVADPVQTEQARQTTRSRQCEDAIRQVLNLEPNAPRRPDTTWT